MDEFPESPLTPQASTFVAGTVCGELQNDLDDLIHKVDEYARLTDPSVEEETAHAGLCRRLGMILMEADRVPEAMQYLQEATDVFGRLPECESDAASCAKQIVDGVRSLRQRPSERLYLLMARINREKTRIELEPGTETLQGDCAFRMATIFHRRDRFPEAETEYVEALRLYQQGMETELQQAACHQRLGGLHRYELRSISKAAEHYKSAAQLFREYEPESEGEQMNLRLCEALLADVKRQIKANRSRS